MELTTILELVTNHGIGIFCVGYLIYFQSTTMKEMLGSLNSINESAGTDVGTVKLVLACTIGNSINAIAAANQTFTCAGIGYVLNNGAAANKPDNLVNIAIKSIIFVVENNTSKLNILHSTY